MSGIINPGDPTADDVNSTGSDTSADAAEQNIPWAAVDSGLSDDIQSSVDAQGVSDRETAAEAGRDESDEAAADEAGLDVTPE